MTDGQDLLAAFPYGAHVITNTGTIPYDMVRLSLSEDGDELTGYAYPNKDFYFDLDRLTPGDGDWVVKSKGQSFRFVPLTKQRGQAVVDLLTSTGS